MAPQVGFEPTTLRLTAECSAIELLRSVCGARIQLVLQYGAPIYSCSGSELGFIRARVRARIRSGSSAKLECASSDYHNIRVRGKKTGNGLVV